MDGMKLVYGISIHIRYDSFAMSEQRPVRGALATYVVFCEQIEGTEELIVL